MKKPGKLLGGKHDTAVSDIMGSILLITIVVMAASIIGVALLSQPTPQSLPALDAVISTDTAHKTIQIFHDGGDLIPAENLRILVDGVQTPFTKDGSSTWSTWAIGESLDYSYTGNDPATVQIVYGTVGSATVLASANFANPASAGESPTATPTATPTANTTVTVTPTPEPAPVADFTGTPTSGTVPLTVQFTDLSTNTPTSWSWDFGDGDITNSTVKSPAHRYANAGTYTVSLNVSNTGGNSTVTKINYITVNAHSVADFTATPTTGSSPLTVSFTDTSTGTPVGWSWSFGDGNTTGVIERNPVHVYTMTGNYTVNLTVTYDGYTSTVSKQDYIQVPQSAFMEYVVDENVFVYGSKLYFQGKRVIGPGSTVILKGTSVTTGDFNGGAEVAVSNIYIDGDVALDTGSASWGSSDNPGGIYVNGDMTLLSGGRNLYGDIYVAGNFNAKDPKIHGNVYVDGDLTLGWTPTLDTNSRIYYTGTLTVPSNYNAGILAKCIHQATVPGFTMPDLEMPPLKESTWYTEKGYVSGGTLASNKKIFAPSYSSSSWGSSVSNVIIVAQSGDITLTQGWGAITGVLFAPNGKVTFSGGTFEGVVIARDGFYVTSGGTVVTFKNLDEYISSISDYPF